VELLKSSLATQGEEQVVDGKLLLSLLMIFFGVILVALAFLIPQYSEMCSCPAQIVGQPNTCNCDSASPNTFMLIGGIILTAFGAITIIRPQVFDEITGSGTAREITP
jgi:hypothetical protein